LTSKGDLPWWLRFETRLTAVEPFKQYIDGPSFHTCSVE
jgi:hypothetical protein